VSLLTIKIVLIMTVVLYFYGHYLIGELRGKHEKLVREQCRGM
jgi:hypothetical protein